MVTDGATSLFDLPSTNGEVKDYPGGWSAGDDQPEEDPPSKVSEGERWVVKGTPLEKNHALVTPYPGTWEDVNKLVNDAKAAAYREHWEDGVPRILHKREYEREADRIQAEQEEAEALAAGEIPLRIWDLTPYLEGELEKIAPSVLRVSGSAGDHYVLYQGRVNWLHGTSGSGKTIVMLAAVAQELLAGHRVLWIEYEETDPQLLCERLSAMGVPSAVAIAQLVFVTIALKAQPKHIKAIVEGVGEGACSLAVIDSVGEAMGVEGINENLDAEVAPWINRVLRTLVKKLPGAALAVIDHGVKDPGDKGKWYPSGTKRKRAAVTGISILVESEVIFSKGVAGNGRLLCAKDRMGNYAFGQEIGIFTVDGTTPGSLAVEIRDRAVGEAPLVDLDEDVRTPLDAERVWQCAVQAVAAAKAYTDDHGAGPLNASMLKTAITYEAAATVKVAAISHAIARGAIAMETIKNAHCHSYVRDLDDADREFIFGGES